MTKQDDIVQAWRRDNKHELDRTLAVLIGIRDNEDEGAKNRIDAGRSIARMLGALSADKEDKEKKGPEKPKVRTEIEEGLESILEKL
jgi:hypothetical protein